ALDRITDFTPGEDRLDLSAFGRLYSRESVDFFRITGGIELLPDAVIDDGELDLAILTPTSLTEWLGVAGRVLTGRDDGPTIERRRCREVSLHADPAQQVEVDGDVLTEAGEVRVSVQPGALVVRVPQVPQ
ncbi:MAG TPA: hypothetical protein PLB97_05795, partial [Accumulibacter sp.]|nr:hypothetical protein [Accumulibacter sp.]